MAIKYELYREDFEVHLSGEGKDVTWSERDLIDEYERRSCICPQLQESFDTMEEAQTALKHERKHQRTSLQHGCGCDYLLVEVYFVEAMAYDDDGELDGGWEAPVYSVRPYNPKQKKRTVYTDGWHDVTENFYFWVEDGCLMYGVINNTTVYPYRYDRKLNCYNNVSGIEARYGVLEKVRWY